MIKNVRQTSIETYRQIKAEGLLSDRRFEVYATVFKHGPMTAGQASMQLSGKGRMWGGNIHARLNELKDFGVMRELGTTICPVTQRQVILWDVTSRLPVKSEKPKRTKCKHCQGKGFTEETQTKLF